MKCAVAYQKITKNTAPNPQALDNTIIFPYLVNEAEAKVSLRPI